MSDDLSSPVFIACPVSDDRMHTGTARAIFGNASRLRPIMPAISSCGCLVQNFNLLLCHALNLREEEGVAWFAMCHSDVEPEPWWVDTLIAEAEAHDADLMSAVVAIKDRRGLTSTAIGDPDDPWSPWCRLTLNQLWHADFPATFDAAAAARALSRLPGDLRVAAPDGAGLEVNVGCMVYRIDRPWSDRVSFEIRNRIARVDGAWQAQFQPDDWLFSRAVAAAGGRVFATRAVKTIHKGAANYSNDAAWGQDADDDCIRARASTRGEHAPAGVLSASSA